MTHLIWTWKERRQRTLDQAGEGASRARRQLIGPRQVPDGRPQQPSAAPHIALNQAPSGV